MKCPNCDGDGWDDEHMIKCLRCHGSGEVEMTNEEYLKSCDTEHFAWMISLFVGNAIAKHDCGNDEDVKPIKWVEWLKEIHE